MPYLRLLLPSLLCLAFYTAEGRTIKDSIMQIEKTTEFIAIKSGPGIIIDLKYASNDNFVGRNMYGIFNKAYLHKIAATQFYAAVTILKSMKGDHSFVIYDALRPRSVQYVLWDHVKGTPQQQYVADPKLGSMHNYGFALDLSIIDGQGKPLDMGTAYDDFSDLAQPKLEDVFLRLGKLNSRQIENRLLLRKIMVKAGFIPLDNEWWHFDALPATQVKGKFSIVE